MSQSVATKSKSTTITELWRPPFSFDQKEAWTEYAFRAGVQGLHSDHDWLMAACRGLRHRPYVFVCLQKGRMVGLLPLALVKSLLFGRFLVSLPYVNWAGVIADGDRIAAALIDRAVELADKLRVRYLELRHDEKVEHPALTHELHSKVQMRMPLGTVEETWNGLRSVVRTQIRKAERHGLQITFGREEMLPGFYQVFSENMRDLGTPVYGLRLFKNFVTQVPERAELCVVTMGGKPIAAAMAVHGAGITEVPSASALRAFRATAANSLMYWRIIERAISLEHQAFDFGRSTIDGNTFKFKKKWGAKPEPSIWQYYLRKGNVDDMRPEGGKYDLMTKVWRRLPLGLTRLIGPRIVRGIP